jgi:tRNA U38,U39,U40 pseudouridine synthase TruA
MKLHMTGYKAMAPAYATRVDIKASPHSVEAAIWNPPPHDYLDQLRAYIEQAKGEHDFIYFWTSDENS